MWYCSATSLDVSSIQGCVSTQGLHPKCAFEGWYIITLHEVLSQFTGSSRTSNAHFKCALLLANWKCAARAHFAHFTISECFTFCCCFKDRTLLTKPSTGHLLATRQSITSHTGPSSICALAPNLWPDVCNGFHMCLSAACRAPSPGLYSIPAGVSSDVWWTRRSVQGDQPVCSY